MQPFEGLSGPPGLVQTTREPGEALGALFAVEAVRESGFVVRDGLRFPAVVVLEQGQLVVGLGLVGV
jgi:hypothetical protein